MDIMNQVGGFFVTLRQFFKPPVTVQYPDQMRELSPRFRGAVGLLPHPETGREKCVGCGLCPQVCPVDCIHPRKDEPDFENVELLYIHPDECIDCGACEPACPVQAIFTEDDLPEQWKQFTAMNAAYFNK